jgi:hypothetical protein
MASTYENGKAIRVGELLIEAHVVTSEKFEDSLELSKTIGQPVGQILLQSGDLSKYELICAVQVQSLILEDALTRSQGTKVIDLVCNQQLDYEEALSQVGYKPPVAWGTRLGELLFSARLLTPERLRQALACTFESAMPLGQILVRQKFLSPQVVATALTLQSKIRAGRMTREEAIKQLSDMSGLPPGEDPFSSPTTRIETPGRIHAFLLHKLNHLKAGSPSEVMERPEDLIGSLIADRYQVVGYIGGGGMSLVYLVRHTLLDKVMALKIMQPHHKGDAEMVKRFELEARAISAVCHPNVVSVHDYGLTAEGTTYLAMDYVHGNTLGDVIRQKQSLTPAEALPIFRQASSALHHIHGKGIIHRDVKPSNIMLVTHGSSFLVKIVDFGIAKLLDETVSVERLRITKSGELLGSPMYMSPEHCLGRRLDARSDVYSLGCVMYESFTGKPPFVGATAYEIFQRQMSEKPVGLSNFIKDKSLCAAMEPIVMRCLEKDPARRIQSMDELRLTLEEVLRDSIGSGLAGS